MQKRWQSSADRTKFGSGFRRSRGARVATGEPAKSAHASASRPTLGYQGSSTNPAKIGCG